LSANPPAEDLQHNALTKAAEALEAVGLALRALAESVPEAQGQGRRLTPKEVAATWAMSETFVTKACRKGQIRAVRIGNAWRIPEASMAAFERRRTR
jgi:excisionase family DNA binding protein